MTKTGHEIAATTLAHSRVFLPFLLVTFDAQGDCKEELDGGQGHQLLRNPCSFPAVS